MDESITYPKVMIVSEASWSNTNNIGNTYSNIFGDWPKEKISMIYTRGDLPRNNVCENYFQISESRLIKNIFNKNILTGMKVSNENNKSKIGICENENSNNGESFYSFFRKYRWNIFLNARNLLWKITNWKTKELDNFIDNFDPDVIFLLASPETYINTLQSYVINKTQKNSAIYFVDDIYSLKQFSVSPFYWINKFFGRKNINKTVKKCELVYTIVPKQKKEYDSSLKINSRVLNKGIKFKPIILLEEKENEPYKLVFTGNIYSGRWKVLVEIGKVLDKLNKPCVLKIYTQNLLDSKMKKAFSSIKSIELMGGIPAEKVEFAQLEADILIHVESFNLKEKFLTRLSFSTKLVDYFERGRCIFAVGWKNAASIEYLKENNAAVIVDNLKDLETNLRELLESPEEISKFSIRARELGEKNHRIDSTRKLLKNDLISISKYSF
ncbi:hypothetical protein ACQKDD_18045 [Planococcus kocurii]|uniref:hypothetical protein n=1 Tax=Planococcus kocurii TaxID=1374 RepID=UPI003D06F024